MADMATVLGKANEAAQYREGSAKIKAAFAVHSRWGQ
jgi:hypothetical protein